MKSRILGAVVAAAFLSLALSTGCSDTSGSRRLGEYQAIQYKKTLIASSAKEISPEQAEKLMYHSGRTQDDIDAYLEVLKAEFAAQQEAEQARLDAARAGGE